MTSQRRETVWKVGRGYGPFHHLIYVDVETRRPDGVHISDEGIESGAVDVELHLGVAVHVDRTRQDLETWCIFDTADEFWHWVDSLQTTGRVAMYAHNMRHDATFLDLDNSPQKFGWRLSENFMSEPVWITTLEKHDRRPIKMLCSSANLPTGGSIDKIGEDIGIPKLEMPADDAPMEQWIEYCKRDVEVGKEFILRYWEMLEKNQMGDPQYTLASQASWSLQQGMRDWPFSRRPATHDDIELRDFERAAIHGPRIEAFYTGPIEELSYKLDCVSLYASVMKGNLFSVRTYKDIQINPSIERVQEALIYGMGMLADVTLQTDIPAYPAPGQNADAVAFPVGRFRTTLATPELFEALRRGHIVKVHRAQAYKRDDMFTQFVDKIWRMIDEVEPQNARLCKQMLRSLWGRLAARYQRWQPAPEFSDVKPPPYGTVWEMYDPDADVFTHLRSTGKAIEKRSPDDWEWGPASSPMIAAEVISYARLRMWELIEIAGFEDCHYITTDALIVGGNGYLHLAANGEVGEDLGKMRLEECGPNTEIFRPHGYVSPEGEIHLSGVRADDLLRVEDDGTRVYRQFVWPRYGSPQGEVMEHRITLPPAEGRYTPEARSE